MQFLVGRPGRKYAQFLVNLQRIRIDDDGPGVPPEDLNSIRQRGKRLDETRKGFGLGLSIVEDITDIYEIDLGFLPSPLGGLRVELWLKS